jgi:hypothetical protein
MICRLWGGWTTADDADESCLREELYRTPRTARTRFAHGAR